MISASVFVASLFSVSMTPLLSCGLDNDWKMSEMTPLLSCGLDNDWKMSEIQFLIHDKYAVILAVSRLPRWAKPALAPLQLFYPGTGPE